MEDIKEQEQAKNDMLMVLFYVGKLVEGGFIAGGPKVTVDGFDIAMDLKEAGYKLNKETVEKICEVYKFEPIDGFTALILEVQKTGLAAMIVQQQKLEDEAKLN
jgi:hypothetical protein